MTQQRVNVSDSIESKIDFVDVCETHADVPQEQICRTCVNTHDRLWQYSVREKFDMDADELSAAQCQPSEVSVNLKVLRQTDWQGRIISVDEESEVPTSALVDSCGQSVQTKCRNCDRFEAVRTHVPYTTSGASIHWGVGVTKTGKREVQLFSSDGSDIRKWPVVIGGHCTIPAEGFKRGDTVVYCDPQPRKKNIDNPSCDNCKWQYYTGENWQAERLEVNRNADLTPWEREQAELNNPDKNRWQAIGLARWQKETDPKGQHVWHEAKLLKAGWHDGVFKYKVKFTRTLIEAIIEAGDFRFEIHCDPNLTFDIEVGESKDFDNHPIIAVDVQYPYNELLNLPIPIRSSYTVWPDPVNAELIDTVDLSYLVNDSCKATGRSDGCKEGKPCYFHAKAPSFNKMTGDYEFNNTLIRTREWKFPPHGTMKVIMRGDRIVAVDGNDNLPETYGAGIANASVFRRVIPGLLLSAHRQFGSAGVAAIKAQYAKLTIGLVRRQGKKKIRPAWIAPSTIEPGKIHCSHPLGDNLRKVFSDSFGLERVEFDFDFGPANKIQVEEEIRTGYRQHEHTPQKLQEEQLVNIRSHRRYDSATDSVPPIETAEPDEWSVTRIDCIGDMMLGGTIPITNTKDFVDMLDDEVHVGQHGQSDRIISRRQQLYGYQLSRGYYGKRRGAEKTAMPSFDNEMAIFEWEEEPDQIDIENAWGCPECHKTYDHSEIDTPAMPTCDCGCDLVYLEQSQPTHNPRANGGIGSAIAMDSPRMMQRRLMQSNLCKHWELRGSSIMNPVRISDTLGPDDHRPAEATETELTEAMRVIKVSTLTANHREVNRDYHQQMDEIIRVRGDYIDQYPNTTHEELVELFPTPTGTLYQEKAAGSLSKMG